MFGTDSSQLLRRLVAVTPECRDRSDRRSPLRGEHFPVHANGREIVAQDGAIIAIASDAAMSEKIVRRLNKTDWNDRKTSGRSDRFRRVDPMLDAVSLDQLRTFREKPTLRTFLGKIHY